MKDRLDTQARRDLTDIRGDLIDTAGSNTTELVRNYLRSRIALLAKRPLAGIDTSRPDDRVLSPTKCPYRIHYSISCDQVVVLPIRPTSRPPPDEVPPT